MNWRTVAIGLFFLVLSGPIIAPFGGIGHRSNWVAIWSDWQRLGELAGNTGYLLLLVGLITVPPALSLSILLGTTDLPHRHSLSMLLVVGLLIPLPVTAVAWQATSWVGWSPFRSGILAAAWIHSVAALPWLVAIFVSCLSLSDPIVDDDARIGASIPKRCAAIILPRLRWAIWLGVFWIAATVAGEIVVTDLMLVRTFGEEVYTQFVSPTAESGLSADQALERAILTAVPAVLVLCCAAWMFAHRHRWPRLAHASPSKPLIELGRGRQWCFIIISVIVLTYFLYPIVSLALRAGSAPRHPWSIGRIHENVLKAMHESTWILLHSLLWAFVTGAVVSAIVLLTCWSARTSRTIRTVMFSLAVAAAVTPAPIIGLGMKQVINYLLDVETKLGRNIVDAMLYNGPSYLPVAWVWAIRCFPLAVAVLWPTVRNWPSDSSDAIKLESAKLGATIRHIVWPLGCKSWLMATGLTALYCFGEVSASRIAATPDGATFAHDLFTRMHNGLTPDLAGQCLYALIIVLVAGLAWLLSIKPRSAAN